MKFAVRTQIKGTVARHCFLIIPTYLGYKIRISKILDFSSFLFVFHSILLRRRLFLVKVSYNLKFVICSFQARIYRNHPFDFCDTGPLKSTGLAGSKNVNSFGVLLNH
jgi:hypothetical protein